MLRSHVAKLLLILHLLTVFVDVDSIRITTQSGGGSAEVRLSNIQSYVCNSA